MTRTGDERVGKIDPFRRGLSLSVVPEGSRSPPFYDLRLPQKIPDFRNGRISGLLRPDLTTTNGVNVACPHN